MIEYMKKNLSGLERRVDIDQGYGMMQEGERKLKYQQIMEDIQGEMEEQLKNRILSEFDQCLKLDTGWGKS